MNATVLLEVINETGALFHRLKVVGEEVHSKQGMTAGLRGVLFTLDTSGPQTVAAMARLRPVSRQDIQKLVNVLLAEKLVETTTNPEHRRSYLVRLTPRGKKLVSEMKRREVKLLSRTKINVTTDDLEQAASILRTTRQYFESADWKKLLDVRLRA